MTKKKERFKVIGKINIEEPACCRHAERFWEEIDGIIEEVDSYDEEKRRSRLDELNEAFGIDIES